MDELDRLREQGGKTSAVIRLFQCITGPRVRRQYFLGLTNEVNLATFCCGWSLIRNYQLPMLLIVCYVCAWSDGDNSAVKLLLYTCIPLPIEQEVTQ